MPKNKKDSSGSDSDSSFDTDVRDKNPPAKKAKTDPKKGGGGGGSSATKSSNGEITWNLSSNKLVKLRNWRGKSYIDIREYYEKDGELLPGKKGISLTPDLYHKFKNLIPEIDEELNRC